MKDLLLIGLTAIRQHMHVSNVLLQLIFREIQENREQTTESMNQVKATLAAFQEEFKNRLKALGDDINRQIDEEALFFKDTWAHNHKRM